MKNNPEKPEEQNIHMKKVKTNSRWTLEMF